MTILWICNIEIPLLSELTGRPKSPFGGWLDTLSRMLLKDERNRLTVAYPRRKAEHGQKGNFEYYSFRRKEGDNALERIIADSKPDIVHIWGTELHHSLAAARACQRLGLLDRTVVNIQGLVSIYAGHYCVGLPQSVVNSFSIRNIIRFDNVKLARRKMALSGKDEVETLKTVRNVIGRTDWDCAAVKSINPALNYYFCNEVLRKAFYGKQWRLDSVERHSIFVSQCSYPIKGFHFLLKALPLLVRDYPDIHVYTTGRDLINGSLNDKLMQTAYQQYLGRLMREGHLEEHVSFLGTLDEEQMCDRYLKANVFVSPSTVENSSNSICEAMLVGCPVVSSYVGGAQTLIEHGKTGLLYQADAPYMLAYYIAQVFENDALATQISAQSREAAVARHDAESVYNNL